MQPFLFCTLTRFNNYLRSLILYTIKSKHLYCVNPILYTFILFCTSVVILYSLWFVKLWCLNNLYYVIQKWITGWIAIYDDYYVSLENLKYTDVSREGIIRIREWITDLRSAIPIFYTYYTWWRHILFFIAQSSRFIINPLFISTSFTWKLISYKYNNYTILYSSLSSVIRLNEVIVVCIYVIYIFLTKFTQYYRKKVITNKSLTFKIKFLIKYLLYS